MTTSKLPALHDPWMAAQVGGKFASLADAAHTFSVPTAIVVPVAHFSSAIPLDMRQRIATLMNEIEATAGVFFGDAVKRLARIVSPLRMPQHTEQLVRDRIAEIFDPQTVFAVRSSAVTEDGRHNSFAGAYESFLRIATVDGVVTAIERCWRSYYSPTAIAARVRAADFSADPAMAVIIQEYVDAAHSGVAFSFLDVNTNSAVVEHVAGPADGLVAGLQTPCTAGDEMQQNILAEVIRVARQLRTQRGYEVDLEWAADRSGTVYVLQVRPVTAARSTIPARPWTSRLYFDQPPDGAQLGEVAALYTRFEAKRGPANRLAAAHGVDVTTGWLFGFTGRALHDDTITRHTIPQLLAGRGDESLLDFGDSLRQLIVPKPELLRCIREVFGAERHSDQAHAVLVRNYLRGELGFISRTGEDAVIVEYAPDGLLALNRGTSGAERLIADHDGNAVQVPVTGRQLLPHLKQIVSFTKTMNDQFGDVGVEWALCDGSAVFLDYSPLGPSTHVTAHSATVISDGTACGPVLTIADSIMLTRVSIGPAVSVATADGPAAADYLSDLLRQVRMSPEPPIVRASRPYAALSILIGSVAGFVFEQGSVLSHLAILLREAKVPAVFGPDVTRVPDGAYAVLSSGTFTVAVPDEHTPRARVLEQA